MAEENAAKQAPVESSSGGGKNKSSMILIVLATINMLVVAGVGFMLFQNRKKEASEPKIEQVTKGEKETQDKENKEEKQVTGKIVPLETFLVNLAGSKGRRIAKVNIELELKGDSVSEEIEKRKAQIRDIIIILLSSKTYDQVSEREGKEQLREEVKDTVNAFLTKGKILNVYFTDFIYQ